MVGKSKKSTPTFVAENPGEIEDEILPDPGDAVIFDEVESFLQDHGIQHGEVDGEFDETETAELLAATWKEKRTEIARLQRSRNFRQVNKIQQQFKEDVNEVKKRTRCRRCSKVGHWARECPLPKGQGKGSSGSSEKPQASGAAMVLEKKSTAEVTEVMLVSSPGRGIIDSGCGKTLIGQETLNQMIKLYQSRNMDPPKLRRQSNFSAFGSNREEATDFVAELRVGINGRVGRVDAAIVKGPAPLLLSRNTMRSLRATLNFANNSMSLNGEAPQPLRSTRLAST